MRLSLSRSLLALAATALPFAAAAGERLIESKSLNPCMSNSSFSATLFNVVFTPNNRSLAFDIEGISNIAGKVEADLPIKELGDEAPEYDRPWLEPRRPAPLDQGELRPPNDLAQAILKLMGSPDLASRRWVFEQYDHVIGSNTAQLPGGDAAVLPW